MKYIDVEKLKAEIKRRHDYENEMYHKTKPDGRPNEGWAESLAIMGVLEELLSFLDILSEEPDKSLEEAADKHINKVVDAAGHPGWDWTTQDIADAFKAGAEWQKSYGVTLET